MQRLFNGGLDAPGVPGAGGPGVTFGAALGRLAAGLALPLGIAAAADWTHVAGDAARSSRAAQAPDTLSSVGWIATTEPGEEFVASASPVVAGGRVFTNVRVFDASTHVANRLIAFDAASGERLWDTPLDADTWDSWSGPAYDARHDLVYIATRRTLAAVAASDGAVAWTRPLPRDVVNASPCVSDDLHVAGTPANRLFLTDFGGTGALYAVNVDPFDAANNPWQPGEIAWIAPLNGASGNSPAYSTGRVYVATRGGSVRAYDALAGGSPLWSTSPGGEGFYGGVSVQAGFVYAATYDFHGGQDNSHLHKLRADTGAVEWSVPCERTSSIPVVAGNGCIFLASGIQGFGSAAKVQCFDDFGTSAALRWDTFSATAGKLLAGGWTTQPLIAGNRLYVGTISLTAGLFGPCTDLRILNLDSTPATADFVIDHAPGAGGTPAAAGGWLYSIGPDGLVAFRDLLRGDANCDGGVDFFDIDPFVLALFDPAAYMATFPACDFRVTDVNGDGTTDFFDIDAFLGVLF